MSLGVSEETVLVDDAGERKSQWEVKKLDFSFRELEKNGNVYVINHMYTKDSN